MIISQWKNGDRTFFSLKVDDRLLLIPRCLPKQLTMSSASQVLELTRNQPNLAGLGKLCESFLRNSRLQQELATLVRYSIVQYGTVKYHTIPYFRQMHEALNQVLLMVGGKTFDEEGVEITPR